MLGQRRRTLNRTQEEEGVSGVGRDILNTNDWSRTVKKCDSEEVANSFAGRADCVWGNSRNSFESVRFPATDAYNAEVFIAQLLNKKYRLGSRKDSYSKADEVK